MLEQVIKFNPHGLSSPEVQARIAGGPEIALARMSRINARIEPHWKGFVKRLTDLLNARKPLHYKIVGYWRIVDEMMAFNGDDVACKRGCSHCCHAAVLVPHAEAAVIGTRIKRKPEAAKQRRDANDVPWGYEHPCTFLVDNECSIYENRPTVCRVHYSLDVDALMCELTPPESKAVPFMNDMNYQMTLLRLIQSAGKMPSVGEIRELFPKVKS